MSEDDDTAQLAARRRRGKSRAHPEAPAVPAPVAGPPAEVADVAADAVVEPLGPVRVSRSALADYLLRTDGPREFGRAAGSYEPILPPGSAVPLRGDYVRAEFEATEEMIPPRARTPVSRLLFRPGWLVRRDVYDEISRQQREGTSTAAGLPSAAEVPPPLTDGGPGPVTVGAPAEN